MSAEPPSQIRRLSDVQRATVGVAEHVHAGCARCFIANAFADAPPGVAPILDDERLFDQAPRKSGGRAADPQDFAREALVIGTVSRLLHLREPGGERVPDHFASAIVMDRRRSFVAGTTIQSRETRSAVFALKRGICSAWCPTGYIKRTCDDVAGEHSHIPQFFIG
jgi:hypothetical protein